MTSFRSLALQRVLFLAGALFLSSDAFVPSHFGVPSGSTKLNVATEPEIDERTGKPTGTSFLPEETVERAKVGNKIEKIKMAKDGTSAFVDVYEYAAKIRAGEMTWEEVESADMDNVSFSQVTSNPHEKSVSCSPSHKLLFLMRSMMFCSILISRRD